MADTPQDGALSRLSDSAILALLEAARTELVVSPVFGYHVWMPMPDDAPNALMAALIKEVYRRQGHLRPYAEANTARLRALGIAAELDRVDADEETDH